MASDFSHIRTPVFTSLIWVAFLCAWVASSAFLYHSFHAKLHQQGISLVKEIEEASLDPNNPSDVDGIQTILERRGFSLGSIDEKSQDWFYNNVEHEVFTAEGITLTLKHPTIGIYYAHWFVVLTGLFIGVGFGLCRWNLRLNKKLAIESKVNASHLVNQSPQKPDSAETVNMLLVEQYGLFSLVNFDVKLPEECDAETYFNVVLAKAFTKYQKCRVRYLNDGLLAITFPVVPKPEIQDMTAVIHEQIFKSLRKFRHDLSRKAVKVGTCYYPHKAEQAKVYQLARSALAIATNNLWHHYHCQPLNHTQSELFEEQQEVLNYITRGRFLLLFQPLIGFDQQDIVASEALLRVRHSKIGLMSAKQFIVHVQEPTHFIELDKHVIGQVFNLLNKEPSNLDVHINIHCMSWCSSDFRSWLLAQLADFKYAYRLVFEIAAFDFYQYSIQLHDIFCALQKSGARVMVDHIEKPLEVSRFRALPAVVGLKLSVELVHNIEVDLQRQRLVREIVTQAKLLKLPVFAIGVETHQTLLCLQKLGIKGAQGHYFSEPLQQFSDSDLISGHDT